MWLLSSLIIKSSNWKPPWRLRKVQPHPDKVYPDWLVTMMASVISVKENVHKGCPIFFEIFWDTYLLTYVLYIMYYLFMYYVLSIYVLCPIFLTYLPTPKSDILYGRSQRIKNSVYFINAINQKSSANAELAFSIIPNSDETCSCPFCKIFFGRYFGIKICCDF